MAQADWVRVNGEPVTEVSVRDRGLQYGDGLFETMAARGTRIAHWDRHMARLARGCQRLGIEPPDPVSLARDVEALLTGAEPGLRAVIKVIVTRGSGGRGYRPPLPAEPTRIVSRHDWPAYPSDYATDGIRLGLCETRLSINPRLAGIKHLNRLEQVLARGEWGDEYAECLMRDTEDYVVCGTMTNLFVLREGGLVTPPIDRCGIAGITRQRVIEAAAALGLPCKESRLTLDAVQSAAGLFVCNAIAGLWPVREFAGKAYVTSPPMRALLQALAE